MTFRPRASTLSVLVLVLLAAAAPVAHAQDRQDFSIQSYYGIEFDGSSSNAGLLALVGIQNITGTDFRNMVITFPPTDPLKTSLGPEELRRKDTDSGEFTDRLESGAYIYEQSFLGKGQTLTVFFRLSLKNMLRENNRLLVLPKVEISYTLDHPGNKPDTQHTFTPLYADEYRLPWDSFQGTVDAFLSRHADISVRLTRCLPDRQIRFMKPVSVRHDAMVVGVGGSSDGQGFFRIQAGFPGSKDRVGTLQEILAYWRIQDTEPSAEGLLQALDETVRYLGSPQDFAFSPDGEPAEVKILRERAQAVSGDWENPQENRLGEGRFRFYSYDVIKNIERTRIRQNVFLLLRTQANSSGLTSDQPDAAAADKAAQDLLDELIGCFEKE